MGYISAAVEGVAADAPAVTKAIAFTVRHVPGGMLLARGLDFFVGDPLHHYMETGGLCGPSSARKGGTTMSVTASARRPPPWSPWRPLGAYDLPPCEQPPPYASMTKMVNRGGMQHEHHARAEQVLEKRSGRRLWRIGLVAGP
ncbi:MAG TPA: hypothetical protein VFR23_23240 [Jiangellaceae bacterium]|nr:hypothetical protein [Jiangellaceae bacterium]